MHAQATVPVLALAIVRMHELRQAPMSASGHRPEPGPAQTSAPSLSPAPGPPTPSLSVSASRRIRSPRLPRRVPASGPLCRAAGTPTGLPRADPPLRCSIPHLRPWSPGSLSAPRPGALSRPRPHRRLRRPRRLLHCHAGPPPTAMRNPSVRPTRPLPGTLWPEAATPAPPPTPQRLIPPAPKMRSRPPRTPAGPSRRPPPTPPTASN